MTMLKIISLLLLPIYLFGNSALPTDPSTVQISISEIMVGQEVTFTFKKDANCGPTSNVYAEGTEQSEGTVLATPVNISQSQNLADGVSMWKHVYNAPGDYYVWFQCGTIIGGIQANTKAGKSVPVMVVAAIQGLPGAGSNNNRIRVLSASSIPTLSQWGIIILSIILLCIGVIQIKSRAQVRIGNNQ